MTRYFGKYSVQGKCAGLLFQVETSMGGLKNEVGWSKEEMTSELARVRFKGPKGRDDSDAPLRQLTHFIDLTNYLLLPVGAHVRTPGSIRCSGPHRTVVRGHQISLLYVFMVIDLLWQRLVREDCLETVLFR